MNIRWINLPDLSRVARYKNINITFYTNKNVYETFLDQKIVSDSLDEIINKIDQFILN